MFGRKKKKKKEKVISHITPVLQPEQDTVPKIAIGAGLEIALGNAQHQGGREYQEDSFGFSDTEAEAVAQRGLLAVLADGMGGLSNGKAVSETVVARMLTWYTHSPAVNFKGEDLKAAISQINAEISATYSAGGAVRSGSTVVAATIKRSRLHWLCVGDSRIYLKRGKRIYQVNEDHDFLNQLLDEAIIAGEGMQEPFLNPQKDSLVGCIGKPALDCFDYSKSGYPLEGGDKIMLCSDGVYNSLSESELSSLLDSDPMSAAESIKNEVLKKGYPGQDNLTVIVIAIYQKGGV